MLKDFEKITVVSGRGGNGCVSFRREKFVPRGGPDGGDGGNGGDIYFESRDNLDTLQEFSHHKLFKAEEGGAGRAKNMHGANGEDIVIKVPPGTIIYKNGNKIVDLKTLGEKILIAKGGKGGHGNTRFKSSTNRTPMESTPGEDGQKNEITLELRLIADIGLIGLPNAGKSTLLSVISNAKPKIADYPFTTIDPNLAAVDYKHNQFVVADIPGLIEGSATGKGLGIKFLRHIKRTKILVHLIDSQSSDYLKDYQSIRTELENFDKELGDKKEIIVKSKTDLGTGMEVSNLKFDVEISSATMKNIDKLLDKILAALQDK